MHLAESEVHKPEVVVFCGGSSRTLPTNRAQGRHFMVSVFH